MEQQCKLCLISPNDKWDFENYDFKNYYPKGGDLCYLHQKICNEIGQRTRLFYDANEMAGAFPIIWDNHKILSESFGKQFGKQMAFLKKTGFDF
jgi:hypothetical protein